MAVAANEKLRWFIVDFGFYIRAVAARVTANVSNPNIYIFSFKTGVLRPGHSYLGIVNIAIHSTYRRYFLQSVGYVQRTNIPGMPYFIAALA